VLVPGGLVVHDLMTLAEPQLVPRRMIARISAAPPGSAGHDLGAGATGLRLQVICEDEIELLLRRRRATERLATDTILVAPSRPGRALALASGMRLPVRAG